MKFRLWRRLKSVETNYKKSLNILCDMFEKIAESCKGDQEQYKTKMNEFQESEAYNKYIYNAVSRMVTPLMVGNEKTWREAARKASKGRRLYKLLMEEVKQNDKLIFQDQVIENVNLIRTLPNATATKVVNDIVENALKGKRAKSIEKLIVESTNKHSRASARLIARTEVSKTTTALTKARSEGLGLSWYIWRTALDGDRVRKSHRNMEGVIVNWNNPPSPESLVGEKSVGNYHAGNIWNCRCYPEPIIDAEDVPEHCKVYLNGTIERMSKTKFISQYM